MKKCLDCAVITTIAARTFRYLIESPIAYIAAILFYGFVGAIFAPTYFSNNQVSIQTIAAAAPWLLWFVVPALTMGLLSDEFRSGTFEALSTLPVRDEEIILGKFFGYALLALALIGGLLFYPILISFTGIPGVGLEWGTAIGGLAGLYLLSLAFGAMGLFASSLSKNQVVAFISGMILCTVFFFVGQFYSFFPDVLTRVADYVGVVSHLQTLARGVWDFRDLFYFGSLTAFFLYLTVQRLSTRRF